MTRLTHCFDLLDDGRLRDAGNALKPGNVLYESVKTQLGDMAETLSDLTELDSRGFHLEEFEGGGEMMTRQTLKVGSEFRVARVVPPVSQGSKKSFRERTPNTASKDFNRLGRRVQKTFR